MKDDDFTSIMRSFDVERLNKIRERDDEELNLEKGLERLTTVTNDKDSRIERIEEAKRISRGYYKLGNDLVEESKYSEAIELYTKSIEVLRKHVRRIAVDSYFNRAITYAMLGYPQAALGDMKLIVSRKPDKPDVYFVLGQIYESINKRKLAERMYKKSLEIDPNYSRSKFMIKHAKNIPGYTKKRPQVDNSY